MLINLLSLRHLCRGIALLSGVLSGKQLYATYLAINYSFKKAGGGHFFLFDLVKASLKAQQRTGYFWFFAHLGNPVLLPFEEAAVVGIVLGVRKEEIPELVELIWHREHSAPLLLPK